MWTLQRLADYMTESTGQGRDEKAEGLYQQALRIRKQSVGAERIETATLLYDFASFQQEHGKHQEEFLGHTARGFATVSHPTN